MLPGQAAGFPGSMEPFFFPFFGEGERLTIAVNVFTTGGKHAGLK
jgi:hypothetical protein